MAEQLKREIGLRTATALIVGEIIAVGIFLTPAGMAKALGSPFWLLVVWLVVGGLSLCGALCFGELAVRFPEAGGLYAYLREEYGPALAFLFGWMALLVMDPGLTAAHRDWCCQLRRLRFTPVRPGKQGSLRLPRFVVLALVNIRGVKLGGLFVRWLTVLKISFLVFIVLCAFVGQKGTLVKLSFR